MQESKSFPSLNIISNIFLVFGFAVFGAIIGILVGVGITRVQESGTFIFWKLLDSQSKFTQIDAGAYSKIIAKSTEDKLYTWDCNIKNDCQWIETQNLQKIDYNDWVQKGTSCQFPVNPPLKDPPGKVVECVFTRWVAGEGAGVDYYALLEDGKVWHWKKSGDMYGYLFLIFISTSICCILGIMIGIEYVNRRMQRKQHKNSNLSYFTRK